MMQLWRRQQLFTILHYISIYSNHQTWFEWQTPPVQENVTLWMSLWWGWHFNNYKYHIYVVNCNMMMVWSCKWRATIYCTPHYLTNVTEAFSLTLKTLAAWKEQQMGYWVTLLCGVPVREGSSGSCTWIDLKSSCILGRAKIVSVSWL